MKTKMFSNVLLLFFLSVLSTSCFPPGQRLLTFQIVSGGSVVYEGGQGVVGSTPTSEMWDILGDIQFEPIATAEMNGSGQLPKDNRTVTGEIVIRINHGMNLLASVTLQELTLTSGDNGQSWSIADDDLKKIKKLLKESNE